MNKVILSGTIEKDIEIKKTKGGNSVSTITLKCFNDESKKSFLLMDCVFWNDKAETIEKVAKKGSYLEIEGRISKSSYKVDNQTVYKTEVIVDRFELVGSYTPSLVEKTTEPRSYENDTVLSFEEDDLPF